MIVADSHMIVKNNFATFTIPLQFPQFRVPDLKKSLFPLYETKKLLYNTLDIKKEGAAL